MHRIIFSYALTSVFTAVIFFSFSQVYAETELPALKNATLGAARCIARGVSCADAQLSENYITDIQEQPLSDGTMGVAVAGYFRRTFAGDDQNSSGVFKQLMCSAIGQMANDPIGSELMLAPRVEYFVIFKRLLGDFDVWSAGATTPSRLDQFDGAGWSRWRTVRKVDQYFHTSDMARCN